MKPLRRGLLISALLFTVAVSDAADKAKSPPTLPDWSGAWAPDFRAFIPKLMAIGKFIASDAETSSIPDAPQFTPAARAYWRAWIIANQGPSAGSLPRNESRCIPIGVPWLMSVIPFEMLLTPERVIVLAENGEVRRIYTDGRPHPQDVDDKFEGHSIGHWEGQTLVVDTIAILHKAEIYEGFPGALNTNKTHVVERMTRLSKDKFQIEFEVTNPDLFTAPYRYTIPYNRLPGELVEAYCEENNRESSVDGEPDLTPPPL